MILVTGATGFLGTHLLLGLCAHNQTSIRALYRSKDKRAYTISLIKTLIDAKYAHCVDQIDWVEADILDIPSLEIAFENITHIYHCAAWIGNSNTDYAMMRRINIKGTANLVNLSLHHNVKKFCHVSSIATLGRYTDGKPIDEEAPRDSENRRSMYSITKFGAEMEVWRASQEGLDVIIFNPGVILGVGFFHSSSGLLFKKVLNNFKFYPPKHSGFVYVKDVINAMMKGMKSEHINQRFIIVSENLSIKAVMDSIAENFNKRKPTFRVNKFLLHLVRIYQWIIGWFKNQTFKVTKDTIMLIDSKFEYDNEKSKTMLQLDYTPIKDCISYIYNDYKKINA